jgi:ABC-type spermidine/putrescine transport system permease subunit II
MLTLPSCFIAYGAYCMRRGVRYRTSKIAAILACIPIVSPMIWFGIPFGIWALLVLRQPAVRRAFGGCHPPSAASNPT